MRFLQWLSFSVFAVSGTGLLPLPDGYLPQPDVKPAVSFSQIASSFMSAAVLGEEASAAAVSSVSPTPTPSPAPLRLSRKKSFTIALLGDSMIDTLGPDAPHLKKALASLYPGRTFTIYNYGVGGTNIDYGLERITSSYTYLNNPIPSLVSRNPDIVVVESFGYNPYPFENGAIEKHWLALASIIDSLRVHLPGAKIVLAATIAPNSQKFGDGAPGISFSPEDKRRRTDVIKTYLDSTVKFARSQHLPIADAYHPSLDRNGDGKLVYINVGDHIHYSDAGRIFFAEKVAVAILSNKMLE